jgi:TM2 domain-containing membrane protein YozV
MSGSQYCSNCGAEIAPGAPACAACGGGQVVYGGGGQAVYGSDKDLSTATLLAMFLGVFGVDRFYLGYTVLGIIKLVTFGGCGIWAFIDLFLIILKKVPDAQGRPLRFVSPVPASEKDWGSALLLSIFLGWLGIDRFYLGYTGLGILKLVTGGGCGVWCMVDSILIAVNKLPDSTGKLLQV